MTPEIQIILTMMSLLFQSGCIRVMVERGAGYMLNLVILKQNINLIVYMN